jgi:hypothetical protein
VNRWCGEGGRSELGRQARRRSRTQARCTDLERLIDRLASIVGVDPGPLTLYQLVLMAEAKRQHDWNVATTIMALMAEMNRDRKGHRKPFRPDDFNPYVTTKPAPAKASVEQVADLLGAIDSRPCNCRLSIRKVHQDFSVISTR